MFAVAGSKFEGIGLENEHIGQTQVADAGSGAGEALSDRCGLLWLPGGIDAGPVEGVHVVVPRLESVFCFTGFG